MSVAAAVKQAVGVSMMSKAELRWVAEQASEMEVIVEVGSWRGGTTKLLASQGGKVYAIDNCEGVWFAPMDREALAEYGLDRNLPMGSNQHFRLDDLFRAYLAEELDAGKVIVNRKLSMEAAKDYPDGFADMVLIDADHEYESVREDIRAWMPKVRKGGFLCGHDYSEPNEGVVKAVDELIQGVRNPVDSIWAIEV